MTRAAAPRVRLLQRWPSAAALGAAALYAAELALASPYRHAFELDRDEGINAGKARLLAHGYALYTPVWNDQPPLFTHVLRHWLDWCGWSIESGRMLVLLFAAVLVFAIYDLTRLEADHRAALVAVAALAASAFVPRLSLSLMIGLPSIALAALALWALFRWRHAGGAAWLLAAGALFGASLAIKLFTAFLLPLFALWIIAVAPRPSDRWRAATLWATSALVCGAALILALGGRDALPQLFEPHLAARAAPLLQRFNAAGVLVTGRIEWPLTLLAWPSFGWMLWRARGALLIFPAWGLTALIALLDHAPVWYHHQLLLSVPYAPAIGVCLAGLARGGGAQAPRRRRIERSLGYGGIAAIASLAVYRVFLTPAGPQPDPRESIVAAVRAHLGVQGVALTTDPMYAFRAGAAAPPALAVLSLKRVATDPELSATIEATFADHPPEVVALGAGLEGVDAALTHAMGDRYRAVFHSDAGEAVTVFARRDDGAVAP